MYGVDLECACFVINRERQWPHLLGAAFRVDWDRGVQPCWPFALPWGHLCDGTTSVRQRLWQGELLLTCATHQISTSTSFGRPGTILFSCSPTKLCIKQLKLLCYHQNMQTEFFFCLDAIQYCMLCSTQLLCNSTRGRGACVASTEAMSWSITHWWLLIVLPLHITRTCIQFLPASIDLLLKPHLVGRLFMRVVCERTEQRSFTNRPHLELYLAILRAMAVLPNSSCGASVEPNVKYKPNFSTIFGRGDVGEVDVLVSESRWKNICWTNPWLKSQMKTVSCSHNWPIWRITFSCAASPLSRWFSKGHLHFVAQVQTLHWFTCRMRKDCFLFVEEEVCWVLISFLFFFLLVQVRVINEESAQQPPNTITVLPCRHKLVVNANLMLQAPDGKLNLRVLFKGWATFWVRGHWLGYW